MLRGVAVNVRASLGRCPLTCPEGTAVISRTNKAGKHNRVKMGGGRLGSGERGKLPGELLRTKKGGASRVGGSLLPARVHTPPLCRPKTHDGHGGPVFLVAGLGARPGRTFSFQATSILLKVPSNRPGPCGRSENPLPPTSTQLLAQVRNSSLVIYNHLASFI